MNKLRRWIRTPRILFAVMAVLLVASVGSATLRPAATSVGTQITLSTDSSVVGVTVGGTGVFAVTASQPASLLGPISLRVTGAPTGTVATVLPNPVLSGVPAVIAVQTAANTPAGTYILKVTATGAGGTTTIDVKLTVTVATGFTMSLAPPLAEVVDGQSTSFALTINRGLLSGPISLTVGGVPQFATASVSPSLSLLGSKATITIKTAKNVLPGLYPIKVSGAALLASASATAYLRVLPETYPDFPVSGTLDRQLAPGAEGGRVDVSITNPFNAAMTVSNLALTLLSTDTSAAPGGCALANYEAIAYGGPATLTIPPNSTRTLSQLGVQRPLWPGIRMFNTAANQDNCKGVKVQYRINAKGDGQ